METVQTMTTEQTRVHGNCSNNDNRTNTGTWKLFKQYKRKTVHTCEVTILVVFISCEPA